MGLYPYADRYPVVEGLPRARPAPRRDPRRDRGDVGGRGLAVPRGQDQRHHLLGRRAHYTFLNEVFGHYSHANVIAARHVPQRHPVRGRDHRHDGATCCTHACRRAAVRRAHQWRHREPDEPAARLPRVGPRARHHHAEPGPAGHGTPGARTRARTTSASRCARRRSPTSSSPTWTRCGRWSTRTRSRSSARPAPTRTV